MGRRAIVGVLATFAACVDTTGLQGGPPRPGPPVGADAGGMLTESGAGNPFLVGQWLFDDGSATSTVANDSSGNGHDATLLATARVLPSEGIRGGGLVLGTAEDAALVQSLAGAAFPRTGTLSLWFKYTFDPADGINRGVFDNHDDRNHIFLRRANGGSTTEFQFALQVQSTTLYAFSADVIVQPRTWAHVTATWDEKAKVAAFYVDGTLTKRETYYRGPYAPDQQTMRLGDDFLGVIDEVRLWKRAFTESEVGAIP